MAIPQREQRILQQKSGNRCAFPDCRRLLTAEASDADRPAVLGEMAHIVAESVDGPRGDSTMTLGERNRYENLILLCNTHHQLIDDQPETYTVERLKRMKEEHEEWVEQTLGRGVDDIQAQSIPYVTETIYSTLLPVKRIPRFIYAAPCSFAKEYQVKEKIQQSAQNQLVPFILRGGMLLAFQDLRLPDGPFSQVVNRQKREQHLLNEWTEDPDHYRWIVDLLNRVLNKLTGRRGLMLDKDHRRYYYPPLESGQEREVTYTSLNRTATRKVVWEPKSKKTGEGHGYWVHYAVALQFIHMGNNDWCLNIRPEFHITADSVKPYPSDKIGSKVTRMKAQTFNYDYLGDIQFWRDVLGEGKPRIILKFDKHQQIIIESSLLEATINWPGIPERHQKSFKNVSYTEDLFSWAELIEAESILDEDDESPTQDEDWGFDEDEELFEE
jgi:hypothetical protein